MAYQSENQKLVVKGAEKGAGLSSLLPPPGLRITTPVFVLSIDGGGIRSLLSLYVLRYLERRLEMPISSVFDVMAATSTASIVAAGGLSIKFKPDPVKFGLDRYVMQKKMLAGQALPSRCDSPTLAYASTKAVVRPKVVSSSSSAASTGWTPYIHQSCCLRLNVS